MPRNKDTSTKVTIIIDDKQNSSICKSFRLKNGLTKKEVTKEINEFLKDTL